MKPIVVWEDGHERMVFDGAIIVEKAYKDAMGQRFWSRVNNANIDGRTVLEKVLTLYACRVGPVPAAKVEGAAQP